MIPAARPGSPVARYLASLFVAFADDRLAALKESTFQRTSNVKSGARDPKGNTKASFLPVDQSMLVGKRGLLERLRCEAYTKHHPMAHSRVGREVVLLGGVIKRMADSSPCCSAADGDQLWRNRIEKHRAPVPSIGFHGFYGFDAMRR